VQARGSEVVQAQAVRQCASDRYGGSRGVQQAAWRRRQADPAQFVRWRGARAQSRGGRRQQKRRRRCKAVCDITLNHARYAAPMKPARALRR